MINNNNKRIAKNTVLLYFRMVIITIVSLYTVRIVLNTLGAEDFGIYNVVGGIVIMFSFLSTTMASASQRFFAFELGRNNKEQLKKTFSVTMTIFLLIAIIILILAETVGIWFLNTKMTIPAERMEAAHWVFQFSIISFMLTLFTIPYNATIIAHEKMNVYAYVSIIEVILKLVIVYILVFFSFDKLKLYAILTLAVTTIVTFIYRAYSKRNFKESHYSFFWDTSLFKEILGFSGWTLLGVFVGIMKNQGVNILINMFFNPVVNAAQAIAYRINSTIVNFTNNYLTAVKPQITKYYSENNINDLKKLIISSSKYSYYLIMVIAFPLLFETKFILSLWLKELPDYTVLFSKIIIINSMIVVISTPVITAIQATGKIKTYQTVIPSIQILILPLTYFAYKLSYPPEITYYISIIITVISFIPRIMIFQKVTKISAFDFTKRVIFPIARITILILIPLIILNYFVSEGFVRFLLTGFCDIVFSFAIIYFLGLTTNEKRFVYNLIRTRFSKLRLNFIGINK